MKVLIYSPNEKINLEDIQKFEKKFKITLPKSYIDFLLESNGGFVGGCHFIIKGREFKPYNMNTICRFYSLKEISEILKNKNHCLGDYIDIIKEYILDKKQIVIAVSDAFFVSMDTSSEKGEIFFLNNEIFEKEGLLSIKKNFEEFINSFKIS